MMRLNPGRSRKGCPNKSADEKRYRGLTDNMLVCNCSGCGVLLLSRKHEAYLGLIPAAQRGELPELVCTYKQGRPLCSKCHLGPFPLLDDAPSSEPAATRFKVLEGDE